MVYVEDEEIQEMTAKNLSRPLILDGTANLDYLEEYSDPASGSFALIAWLRRLFIGK